jgi:hypothetical protein
MRKTGEPGIPVTIGILGFERSAEFVRYTDR